MSTDSTELTFVRCPSCRSLVPAVSTRCRMCGAALDASQKREEPEPVERSSRVRQRTISQPENELSSAVERLRGEAVEATSGGEVEAPTIDGQNSAESELNNVDPLSAYIEEVEVEEQDEGKIAAEGGVSAGPAESIGREDGVAQAGQPASLTKESDFSAVEAKSAAVVDEKEPFPRDEAKSLQGEAGKPESGFQSVREGRSRVIIESGMRRSGKSGGLSFGRPREETAISDGEREGVTSRRDDQLNRRHQERGFERRQREAQPQAARRENGKPNEQHAPASKERPAAAAKREEAGSGRLFGWLVSYANPSGTSTELREGKFFVSRSSLKPNDLLLDDASISTPHALIKVSASEGMQVQDLMSERGVFVRRRSADSYQRVTETVHIESGEWVRFGDVEFLVCLVAHGGTK